MTFIDKIRKPILDISSPMPTITSLHDHFYRRAHEANWPEEKIQCIWDSFSEMMNSWFTLEELQDNKRLSKNKRLMEVIVLMQLPVPFENKEDRVNRIAMAIELSLPSALKCEFTIGERICGYQGDLLEFLHHLCERMLLGDEAKRMKKSCCLPQNYQE